MSQFTVSGVTTIGAVRGGLKEGMLYLHGKARQEETVLQ
jgi:hypothetical protein